MCVKKTGQAYLFSSQPCTCQFGSLVRHKSAPWWLGVTLYALRIRRIHNYLKEKKTREMNPYLRSIDIPLTFFFLIIRSKGIICHQYVSLKVCATHCSTKSNGLRQVKSPIVLNLVIIIVIENERRYEPRVQTKTRYQSERCSNETKW